MTGERREGGLEEDGRKQMRRVEGMYKILSEEEEGIVRIRVEESLEGIIGRNLLGRKN